MTPERRMGRMSRKGFLWSGAALLGGYVGVRYIATRGPVDGTPWPLRRALQVNEGVFSDGFGDGLAPTYDRSRVTKLRTNGMEGLTEGFDPASWRLRLEGVSGRLVPQEVTLDEIKALPRVEMTTELFCIEGWSIVVHWAGARLRDLMERYPPLTRDGSDPDVSNAPDRLARYVALETPDSGYYVGLDMQSAIHPQTLLCYEMNGEPLTPEHGAPLRLAIPIKYGIKNLKRIGTLRYTNERPKDYWAERGYDWFAGL